MNQYGCTHYEGKGSTGLCGPCAAVLRGEIERLTAERDAAKEYADGASDQIRLHASEKRYLESIIETLTARLAAAEARVAVLEGS